MGKMQKVIGCVAGALLLAACNGGRALGPGAAGERNVAIDLLIDFDSDRNQLLSSEEFESAIRADFAMLDMNGDGVLDSIEASVENDRRWARAGSAATPLIDWNRDGSIDFSEYSGALRSTFQELDEDGDGNLNSEELARVEPRAPQGAPGQRGRERPPGALVRDDE